MYRIYRFRIWTTDNECYLYDGIFEDAKEALTFIRDNRADADIMDIRVDAIDFINSALVNLNDWVPTTSDWYHPHALYINTLSAQCR